jgi:hypothetical protein
MKPSPKDFANASPAFKMLNPHIFHENRRPLPNPKPKQNKAAALGATVRGEKKGVRRTRVRFVGYRVKPLDPDNFAGSCKDLLDGLRHAGLISGDEPWRIIFETEQEKVAHYKDERTEIEIT